MAMTDSDTLNYRGELYLIGANQTPFLNMIGGLNGGKRSSSFTFPLAQPYALNAASQNVQNETESAAAGTPTTYTRAQDTNVCQIMKYDTSVTAKKQSTYGTISGINTLAGQPVTDEYSFQKSAALRQMAIDVEYSLLNGTYVAESAVNTDVATRGIITGTTTNAKAAAGGALSKDFIDSLLLDMSNNGSILQNVVIHVNGFQKIAISEIYGYAPADRNVGGLNIEVLQTDFGIFPIVWTPQMPTDTVLFAEHSVCNPMFVPAYGSDVSFQETARVAATAGSGFYYTQIGIDYGPEEYHGKITGLATS